MSLKSVLAEKRAALVALKSEISYLTIQVKMEKDLAKEEKARAIQAKKDLAVAKAMARLEKAQRRAAKRPGPVTVIRP